MGADAADKENQVQSSWADQVEEEEEIGQLSFPPQSETIDGNIKTVVDYKINEDGKKVKVVRRYRIETQKTSKAVARRKLLHKFGKSEKDPSGPNKATTFVSENVEMQFISNRPEDLQQEQEDPMLSKLKLQLLYVSQTYQKIPRNPISRNSSNLLDLFNEFTLPKTNILSSPRVSPSSISTIGTMLLEQSRVFVVTVTIILSLTLNGQNLQRHLRHRQTWLIMKS